MKINTLLCLVLLFGISESYAQKITKESCEDVQVNDKYIAQFIIHGNEKSTYFTEFEKGKGKNGTCSIAKFDKDMKFEKRVMFRDLTDGKDDFLYKRAYKLNGNLLIVFKKELSKKSDLYSYAIVDENLTIVKKISELYTSDEEISQYEAVIPSSDSSSVLFLFGRFSERFAYSKYNNQNKKMIAVVIDKDGNKKINQSIDFNSKETDTYVDDIAFDNENIFFGIYVGISVGQNVVYKGIDKKTDEQKNNYYILKYNVASKNLQELSINKKLEAYYIASSFFELKDGYLYFAGTHNVDKLYANGAVKERFQGHYLCKIDGKMDKIIYTDFTTDKTAESKQTTEDKGNINGIYLKKDGGAYLTIEYDYSSGVSYSSNITLYNYDNFGKLIWKKVVEKSHKGGQLYKGYEFLHTLYFVKDDYLYLVMNENKKNAALPIGTPMEENKEWEKGVQCVSFIYGNSLEKKSIIFSSDESGCEFHDGYNVPVLEEQEKYLTDRRNDVYFNPMQNKVYSIGGIDDKRKLSILKVE